MFLLKSQPTDGRLVILAIRDDRTSFILLNSPAMDGRFWFRVQGWLHL